jgi:hypothetical protein
MQPPDRFALTQVESVAIFNDIIVPLRFDPQGSVSTPELHMIGAQPGAGKSYLMRKVRKALAEKYGSSSIVEIIGDDLRGYHPMYSVLMEDDDALAAYYTDIDSGRWVEQAVDLMAVVNCYVLLEGTLRNPMVSIQSAAKFVARGYSAHLHIVAAHQYISRTRIFARYLEQVRRTGHGRYTLREAHDASYASLPNSVSSIACSGLFDTVTAYDASGNVLLSANGKKGGVAVDTVISAQRDKAAVDIDALLAELGQLLIHAKRLDRDNVARDIEAMIAEITS